MTATAQHPLRERRLRAGFTLEQLAQGTQTTRAAMSLWENGTVPSVVNAMRLARFYGLSTDDLFAYLLEEDQS